MYAKRNFQLFCSFFNAVWSFPALTPHTWRSRKIISYAYTPEMVLVDQETAAYESPRKLRESHIASEGTRNEMHVIIISQLMLDAEYAFSNLWT